MAGRGEGQRARPASVPSGPQDRCCRADRARGAPLDVARGAGSLPRQATDCRGRLLMPQPIQFAHRPPSAWRPVPGRRCRVIRCGLCARRWPRFFDVPDVVWKHYIPPDQRWHVVCLACWNRLIEVTDGGACQAEHGGPLPLWSAAWRVRHGIALDVATHNDERLDAQ
jgi:hypothetical protein